MGWKKRRVNILNKVIEDIDSVNLKDREAWKKILADLDSLIPKIPLN